MYCICECFSSVFLVSCWWARWTWPVNENFFLILPQKSIFANFALYVQPGFFVAFWDFFAYLYCFAYTLFIEVDQTPQGLFGSRFFDIISKCKDLKALNAALFCWTQNVLFCWVLLIWLMQELLDLQLLSPLLGFSRAEYFPSSGTTCQIFSDISFFSFNFISSMFFRCPILKSAAHVLTFGV